MKKNHQWIEGTLEGNNGQIFQGFICPECALIVAAVYGFEEFPPGRSHYFRKDHLIVIGVKNNQDKITSQTCDALAKKFEIPCN